MDKNSYEDNAIRFSNVETYENPFRYFHVNQMFQPNIAECLLQWLESTELFVAVQESFYKQSMFPLLEHNVPDHLAYLFNKKSRAIVREKAERYFQTTFHDDVIVTAHRLLPGQATLIHNDYIENPHLYKYSFTHRIIAYFNRGWNKEDGGLLGIYSSNNPEGLVHSIDPINNTAVGLAFSPISYHAVSTVKQGVRYTINFSFLSKNN